MLIVAEVRPRGTAEGQEFLTGSCALRFDTSTMTISQPVNLQLIGFSPSFLYERTAASPP
jgi:hypothetical protein